MRRNLIGADCPKYCGTCGKELIRKDFQVGYNEYTGKPIYNTLLRCPVNPLLVYFGSHSSSDFDELGREIIHYSY